MASGVLVKKRAVFASLSRYLSFGGVRARGYKATLGVCLAASALVLCWNGNGFSEGPPKSDSATDQFNVNPKNITPLGKTAILTIVLDQMVVVPISGLFFSSSPSTVFGLVVPVIVNSVKAGFRGTCSHVFYKCGKRRVPSVTHSDASSAIPMVMWRIRVIATIFHGNPRTIFRRCLTACGATMFSGSAVDALAALTVAQGASSNNANLATQTHAFPCGLATKIIRCSLENRPLTELFSCQINKPSHFTLPAVRGKCTIAQYNGTCNGG